MEWDAERRARWLYNNRYSIESDAYQRGIKDAETRAYIDRLERERAARDSSYVDRDFAKDPSLMYTDDYVHAAYNPTVVHQPTNNQNESNAVFTVLLGIVVVGCILFGLYYLLFQVKFGK